MKLTKKDLIALSRVAQSLRTLANQNDKIANDIHDMNAEVAATAMCDLAKCLREEQMAIRKIIERESDGSVDQ